MLFFLAEKLTTCQQHLHLLTGYSSLPLSGAFVPKCRSDDGNYKSLQCDRFSTVCFCVDDYDGYALAGSTGVRQAAECAKFGMSTSNCIILLSPFPFIHIANIANIVPLFLGQRPSPPSAPGNKVYAHLVGRAPCARARKQALGALTVAAVGVYVPQCNPDGGFNQRQCHPSTGYCWCVDKAGREMPRTRTRGKPTCDKGI